MARCCCGAGGRGHPQRSQDLGQSGWLPGSLFAWRTTCRREGDHAKATSVACPQPRLCPKGRCCPSPPNLGRCLFLSIPITSWLGSPVIWEPGYRWTIIPVDNQTSEWPFDLHFGDALWPNVSPANYGQRLVRWRSGLSPPNSSPADWAGPSWKYACTTSSQTETRWAGFAGEAGGVAQQGHSGAD